MWAPRRLTALWASTACYRDSFTLPFYLLTPHACYSVEHLLLPFGPNGSYSGLWRLVKGWEFCCFEDVLAEITANTPSVICLFRCHYLNTIRMFKPWRNTGNSSSTLWPWKEFTWISPTTSSFRVFPYIPLQWSTHSLYTNVDNHDLR
jgi:hypothetical protein